MYFVYAIHNPAHNKIYIGQIENLEERIRLHNKHVFGGYTSQFSGEWVLIYKEESKTREQALVREKQLKSFRGREFIRKQIPR
ncbi:MAG: GIY-YIG nuclease family protein [Patescibacteria group bacterium]